MPEDVSIEQIKELVKLVEKHKLSELTVEENDFTVTIRGAEGVVATAPQPADHTVQPIVEYFCAPEDPTPEEIAEAPAANVAKIESPMIGVYYRASSPDSPSFIEVGDTVEVGQPIGIIEAMKVFSEIPSEVAGVVVEIPVTNGKLVQQGETLVILKVD